MSSPSVLFNTLPAQHGGSILEICLNVERSLNALSLEMIQAILSQLGTVSVDPEVHAVVLRGSGERAFCAGGDVVSIYREIKEDPQSSFPADYFTHEYTLDYTLHTFPKPVICWGSGIVMGGGMGLMNGSSHRIVTESSQLAMPEVTIGLYPDVGASWFLNKLPQRTGLFLALTGNPVKASDALFLGLADYYLNQSDYPKLLESLQKADWSGDAAHRVSDLLRGLRTESWNESESPVQKNLDLIQQVTDANRVDTIIERLLALDTEDPWMQRAQQAVSHGSPLSIKLIDEQLHRSRLRSLKEAFISELTLSTHCCLQGDFVEGVRARLVDKDNTPNWQYTALDAVSCERVETYFVEPWDSNPLEVRLQAL